jgi:DNA-binding NarL/FixJ family response regulator
VEKDVEDSLHLGAVSFITKPNKFEQLVHSISNVLGGKYSGVNKHS